MKVLFVSWRDLANPLAGGSEVLIDRLACGLVDRGHDVSLLCGGPVESRPYVVRANGGTYTQYARAPLAYLRHFRQCDLVVDVTNGMSFFAPLWRWKPVLCLVNHVHTEHWGQWFPGPVAALGHFLENQAMPRVYRNHLFVTVSRSSADSLQAIGVDSERIRIVPNGTDLIETAASKSPQPLFLSLSRLVPHKRVELLVRAWERVHSEVGGRLVIAGSGPEAERLAAMAGEGIELVGQVSEEQKRRLLDEAWLLLHPSMLEGWGLVVMEAAAAKTPTIGFDVPGVRESIVHGDTGVLADSEDSFIQQWISLSRDHGLRADMGSAARERAARFSWSATVEQFIPVAEEAIARHHRLPEPRLGPAVVEECEGQWI